MPKRALILVNVGTPDRPEVRQVRRYLAEFLNDPRVIDLPWLARKLLVNLIIVPFRAKKSTRLYRQLWTKEGSPLLHHLQELTREVAAICPSGTDVFGAMRYGNPSLREILEKIKNGGYDEMVIFPLFPQYASSTTGSVKQAVAEQIRPWKNVPAMQTIGQFYDHPAFINIFAQRIAEYHPEKFDHILFSYHGLPNRQIRKVHPGIDPGNCDCAESMPAHGKFCYRATCYQTTRLLADKLQLRPGSYSTAFQSRLSKNWMTPFSDETLRRLARQGVRRVLVAAPAFVADCLETTIEIGYEYREMFRSLGGDDLVLVESLNSSPQWAGAVAEIAEQQTP